MVSKTAKKNHKRAERPGFGDDKYDETSYYFENGLRKVVPYYYTFTTYCKGRWLNQKLVDVFAKEFRALPHQEFVHKIATGSITVNSEAVGLDYVLQNNDFLASVTHRHEVPVTDQKIKMIHSSDELVVVDKPASIPVHPCGRYRHNSVIFILGKEFGLRDLKTIHRLDRLTSGLLLCARTSEKARVMEKQIRSRIVQKEYVCRVEGEFPSESVTCDEPIDVISHMIGLSRVCPDGKPCRTTFERLHFNGKSSVVLCKPETGRMHQIRVHLQFLGYPIVNDPMYNHPAFGPKRGKGGETGKSDEELIRDLISAHNSEQWLETDVPLNRNPVILDSTSVNSACVGTSAARWGETAAVMQGSTARPQEEEEEEVGVSKAGSYDPDCLVCLGKMVFRDPEPSDLVMYLHAWKYKGPEWNFESELPEWAKSGWHEN